MKHSIKGKFSILLFLTTFLISAVLIAFSTVVVRRYIDDTYKENSEKASYVAADSVNAKDVEVLRDNVMSVYNRSDEIILSSDWGSDAFNAYQEQYEFIYDLPEYDSVVNSLRVVQDGSRVDCIYIYYPVIENGDCNFVYLADAAEEDPCPIGCVDHYDWAKEQAVMLQSNPEAGIKAYITNTDEYGWLVSNMIPIFNNERDIVAYACTDISMDAIRKTQNEFTIELIGMAIVIMLIIYIISIIVINRSVVRPIEKLSDIAKNYWSDGKSGVRDDFAKLDITSKDEIGILSESMKKMETDINNYFTSLDETKKELDSVQEESAAMKELATKDALTGVRNKAAYDKEVERIEGLYNEGTLNAYGIAMVDLNYLKKTNDNYGHDKGNISIKKICYIVCNVFKHSPVFRVGGDEFVVILMNGDLQSIDDLMKEFRDTVASYTNNEDLDPWERVSAAIGYAVYDPERHNNATDVFKHADERMYEDKTRQKAGRE